MQRVSMATELLDGPLDDPQTLRGNLRDLRRTNRWLGGVGLSDRAVEALLGGLDEASILDVGTGAADIPQALLRRAQQRGHHRQVTAVDSRDEVIDAAVSIEPGLMEMADLELELADGRSLRYADDSFDIGHASLVIHHLEPDEAVAFLRELARVARVGIVINDLIRSRLSVWGAYVLAHLFTRNRYTRHDAPLSARRAYTVPELEVLFAEADLRVVADFGGIAYHRRAFAAVSA